MHKNLKINILQFLKSLNFFFANKKLSFFGSKKPGLDPDLDLDPPALVST